MIVNTAKCLSEWHLGLCALFDEQIVVEPPHPPSSSRPVNPEYQFVQIGNMQLQKLNHSFTVSVFVFVTRNVGQNVLFD